MKNGGSETQCWGLGAASGGTVSWDYGAYEMRSFRRAWADLQSFGSFGGTPKMPILGPLTISLGLLEGMR